MARHKRLHLGRALQMLGSILMGIGILVVILLIGFSFGPPDFFVAYPCHSPRCGWSVRRGRDHTRTE